MRLRATWVAVAILVLACGGPDAAHYAAVLDELATPQDWELVKSVVRSPDGEDPCDPGFVSSCPAVTRFYLVDADAREVFTQSKQVAEGARFRIERELIPACDGKPSGPACSLIAKREADQLRVTIYNTSADAGLEEDPLGRTAVLVTAEQ